jgi:hypothetical protein
VEHLCEDIEDFTKRRSAGTFGAVIRLLQQIEKEGLPVPRALGRGS